jgi:hypothetical protein
LQATVLQTPGTIAPRFDRPECNETRSWEQISRAYQNSSSPNSQDQMFFTGGMGDLITQQFEVWACFRAHSCLVALRQVYSVSPSEAMCYVYHETEKKWIQWMFMSELKYCNAIL